MSSRTRRITASLVLVAVVAASFAVRSQPKLSSVEDAALQELVETIEDVQARDGILSPQLIGPLTALGLYYREHAEHALAVTAIERARQVVRVHYGLHSLEEAYLLRQLIESETSRGRVEDAWELEQKLLRLVRRHPEDLRTAPILREIADKRVDLLDRYVDGEWPPEIVLGCYYDEPSRNPSCTAGSRGRVIRSILNEAVTYYSQAINVILQNKGYLSGALPEYFMTLVRISHEYGMRALGKKSLRYLVSYRVANGEAWLAQMDALIHIADWDLLFASHRNDEASALEAYEQAYAQLRDEGAPQASIDGLFLPSTPIVLPTFLPNPLVSQATAQSIGHIDVAFDITRYGRSERIEVLDTTLNATDADVDRLVKVIESSRFRPRVTDGRFTASRVALRYLFEDGQDLPVTCRRPTRYAKYGLSPRLCESGLGP